MKKKRNRHTGRINFYKQHVIDSAHRRVTSSDGSEYACAYIGGPTNGGMSMVRVN